MPKQKITIRSTVKPSSNGRNVHIRTSVSSNGRTRTKSKTVRVR